MNKSIALVGCIVGLAIFGLSHLRFRTGWQMDVGAMRPRSYLRRLTVRLMFTALPGIGVTSSAIALILLSNFDNGDSRPDILRILYLVSFVIFLSSGIWAIKEFYSPSESRIPAWLRKEWRD